MLPSKVCFLCQELFASPPVVYNEDDDQDRRLHPPYIHHSSYQELLHSAHQCHLCLKIVEALQGLTEFYGYGPGERHGPVQLYFEVRSERLEPDILIFIDKSSETVELEIRSSMCELFLALLD